MKLEDINHVAIIGGSGIMGSQIAQLFSQAGNYEVTIYSRSEARINAAIQSIRDRLQKYFIDRSKMNSSEMGKIIGRIKGTTDFVAALKNADLVIESVAEDMELKKSIFRQIDENTRPDAILVSNTSQLNITEIASATGRADKIVGIHFFNPASIIKIVEVVRGSLTSNETIETVMALSRKLDKEPILCKDFSFGFLANRAFSAMIMESVQMVWERVASPGDIDKAVKMGYGVLAGPLEVGDRVGLWNILAISETDRIREMGPEKGHLHPLIRMMVRAGYTGGENKGIYDFYKEVLNT